jgi:predicted TIM-barrel fold metal-dependent hydrolase
MHNYCQAQADGRGSPRRAVCGIIQEQDCKGHMLLPVLLFLLFSSSVTSFWHPLPALHSSHLAPLPRNMAGKALKISIVEPSVEEKQTQCSVIDSHLHVWSREFPAVEGQQPPSTLQGCSSAENLLEEMDRCKVKGALIVQPICYMFDHTYVEQCIKRWPHRFKGMCLANPQLSPEAAVAELRRLKENGFVGIRFNAALWDANSSTLLDDTARALYKECGELGMPVGLLCMRGIQHYMEDICSLLEESPSTKLIVDHFGFCAASGNEAAWNDLISLSLYPQVYVKASAFFRVSEEDFPFRDLKPRVHELILAFGNKRIMWGSDFPFIMEECGYENALDALRKNQMGLELTSSDCQHIMGGNAEAIFGEW